jgi:hypothetical protein
VFNLVPLFLSNFWQKRNSFRELRSAVSVVGTEKWKRRTNENAQIPPVLPKVMGEKQQRDFARTAQFFAKSTARRVGNLFDTRSAKTNLGNPAVAATRAIKL